jgi:hypothetical protein
MAPALWMNQAPVPPPSYHRTMATALHLDALTLVTRLHLLQVCCVAVQLAQQQCPPPLPAGPGGAPRVYSEASLVLLALLRTLWRLSYQEVHDWLCAWPALALACGLPSGPDGRPRVPSKAQQSKRLRAAGAPPSEMLFVLLVRAGVWRGLTRGRDLIIDSAPILAWRRTDPDAAMGHAPAHHPRPLLLGYRVPRCALLNVNQLRIASRENLTERRVLPHGKTLPSDRCCLTEDLTQATFCAGTFQRFVPARPSAGRELGAAPPRASDGRTAEWRVLATP